MVRKTTVRHEPDFSPSVNLLLWIPLVQTGASARAKGNQLRSNRVKANTIPEYAWDGYSDGVSWFTSGVFRLGRPMNKYSNEPIK